MSVEYKFMKNFIAFPSSGDSEFFVITRPETLIKDGDDDDLITISINGQQIQKRTAEPTETFSKYYFEVVKDIQAYTDNPTTIAIENSCSLTITVFANQDFMAPGYLSGDHQVSKLSSSDVIFISYWYTMVKDA